jgi:hypothetical protein
MDGWMDGWSTDGNRWIHSLSTDQDQRTASALPKGPDLWKLSSVACGNSLGPALARAADDHASQGRCWQTVPVCC